MKAASVELSVDVKPPRTSGTTRAEGAALPSPGPMQPGHLTTSFVDTAIQMQRDLRVTPKWLIDPRTSKRMGYWDFTTVMALLFTALVTPFEVAFLEPVTGDALYVINWVVNGIFIVDMVFQFCMIYPSETAEGLRWGCGAARAEVEEVQLRATATTFARCCSSWSPRSTPTPTSSTRWACRSPRSPAPRRRPRPRRRRRSRRSSARCTTARAPGERRGARLGRSAAAE